MNAYLTLQAAALREWLTMAGVRLGARIASVFAAAIPSAAKG